MTLGPAKSQNTAASDRATSPAGSFYAMSDDDEGEYNTITHTETGRGVKLLYSKSKVSPDDTRAACQLLTRPIGLHPPHTLCQG